MSSSKTLKSTDTYVPILQVGKDIESLAPQSKGDESRSYKETWNRSAVQEYVTNPTRRHNFTVHESYLKSCAGEYNNSGILGRRPEKNMINQELITNSLQKISMQEKAAHELHDVLQQSSSNLYDKRLIVLPNKYSYKLETRSRRYAMFPGAQRVSRRLTSVALPHLDKWEIHRCMFTITEEIMKRLEVQFPHDATQLKSVIQLNRDSTTVFKSFECDTMDAMEVCCSTFNGDEIPIQLKGNKFLHSLRQEGILMRWVAISMQPGLYQDVLSDSNIRNPESTIWFYLWTSVEDYILECLIHYVLTIESLHLSLHYDTLMIDKKIK
jgi:hypothetical protein